MTSRISPWCATLVWSTHGLVSAFFHVGRQFGASRPNTLACGLRKRPWSFLMGVTIVTPNMGNRPDVPSMWGSLRLAPIINLELYVRSIHFSSFSCLDDRMVSPVTATSTLLTKPSLVTALKELSKCHCIIICMSGCMCMCVCVSMYVCALVLTAAPVAY